MTLPSSLAIIIAAACWLHAFRVHRAVRREFRERRFVYGLKRIAKRQGVL